VQSLTKNRKSRDDVDAMARHVYDTDEVHHRARQLIDRAIDALAAEPRA
jgi:hypothetical protein